MIGKPFKKDAFRKRKAFGYAGTSRRVTTKKRMGYASTKRRPYANTKLKKLARSVRKLAAHDRASLGTMTYRLFSTGRSTVNPGRQTVQGFNVNGVSTFETVLGQLKFFNPATPGTLTTADGAAGTYQRNVRFESQHARLTCRNSYQTPMNIKIYLCHVKDDTSVAPADAWSTGVTDGSNLADATYIGTYPSDVNMARDLWTWKVIKNVELKPGQSVSVSHTAKPCEYDPSLTDAHADVYQREYKAFAFVTVISGVMGHDTVVTNEQTNVAAGFDYELARSFKVTYQAGININYVYVNDSRDTTFTTSGVTGALVTDNQTYSMT